MRQFFFFGVFVFFLNLSCLKKSCFNIEGVTVTDLLYRSAAKRSYPLCSLIERGIEKDVKALKELALLQIYDAASYDHGILLVDVIHKVGDSVFLDAIKNIGSEEKEKVRAYLFAGLEYGKRYPESSQLEQVFPEIAAFLIR